MGTVGVDGKGNDIPGRRRRRLRRQQTRQRRAAVDATGGTLHHGLKTVARLCSALEVPETVGETAGVMLRRARDADLLRGRAVESVAAACVLLAARQAGTVRTLSAVVTASRRPRRPVARAVRHLQRELDVAVEPPSVLECLPAVADALSVSQRLVTMARELLETATTEGLHSGRDPEALAAGAVYTVTLVASEAPPLCQTDVSDAVDVSPPTLRRHFRSLRPLCPDVFDVDPDAIDDPKSRAGRRTDRATEGEGNGADHRLSASED
jgi:transcription initiation factor TFIIB